MLTKKDPRNSQPGDRGSYMTFRLGCQVRLSWGNGAFGPMSEGWVKVDWDKGW